LKISISSLASLPGSSRPGSGNNTPIDPEDPTNFLQLENSAFGFFVNYLAELENSTFVIGLEN